MVTEGRDSLAGLAAVALLALLAALALFAGCSEGARLTGHVEPQDGVMVEPDTVVPDLAEGDGVVADEQSADDGDDAGADADVVVTCTATEPECGPTSYCSYPALRCVEASAQCVDGWCVLPPAVFMMGSDGDRGPNKPVEGTRHPVVLAHGLRMMGTEVTAAEWESLMGSLTASAYPHCGPMCPATGGTRFGKLAFANRASQRDGLEPCYGLEGCEGVGDQMLCERATYVGVTCRGYRLPTEAEAEFAARAGLDYCFDPTAPGDLGDRDAWIACTLFPDLDAREWYCANADVTYDGGERCFDDTPGHWRRRCGYHPVAARLPNAFGLFDTRGNAPELTTSLWLEYPTTLEFDPGHPASIPSDADMAYHVASILSRPLGTCPSLRSRALPGGDLGGFTGFRLVRTLSD